jgi:dTDP-4-dehydrorhamnose reductase
MASARSVLLLGASGSFGPALARALGERVAAMTYLSHPFYGGVKFDARFSSLEALVDKLDKRPQVAVITLGETRIDVCAKDPAGTASVNVDGVIRVVRQLLALDIVPVFTSSDAVFDGGKPWWTEDDETHPILTYGKQKLEVERFMATLKRPGLVVRLPKLVESVVDDWLRKLATPSVIECWTDQFFTPASADDVARALVALVDQEARGLFHLAGPERLSRRELLQAVLDEYRKFSAPKAEIRDASVRDAKLAEPRQLDTSTRSVRLGAFRMPPIRPASSVARERVRAHFGRG